jgi:hypothetical protein
LMSRNGVGDIQFQRGWCRVFIPLTNPERHEAKILAAMECGTPTI